MEADSVITYRVVVKTLVDNEAVLMVGVAVTVPLVVALPNPHLLYQTFTSLSLSLASSASSLSSALQMVSQDGSNLEERKIYSTK